MTIQPPIAPRQEERPHRRDLDEDVRRLIARTGLADFPYHDLHDQERLATSGQRWALLGELSRAGSRDAP